MNAILLAVSVGLSGVMLQSEPSERKPLSFAGAYSLATDGEGTVWAYATDCRLYRLRAGRAEGPVAKNDWAYGRLVWDGQSLLLLSGSERVFRLDRNGRGERVFALACQFKAPPGGALGNRGVVCPSSNAAFAKLGKFFLNDDKRRQIAVYASDGSYVRDFVPYPHVGKPSPVEAMGFMPDTGDLVITTGYPDCRSYRFTADGNRHDTSGWPVFRGDGILQPAAGRLWHVSGTGACALGRVYDVNRLDTVDLAPDRAHRGYAVGADGWEYHASYQAVRGRKVGTSSFRRIGGLGFRPTAMAADERTVYLYGGRLKRLWIDEPPDGSYSGDGDLRQVFSYTEDIVGLAPFDGELYAAAPKSGLVFCSERYKGVPTSGPKWRKVKTGVTGGCLAVAADELSREVHFSVGGDLYHGAVLPVDGKPADKWDLANVRRIAGIGGLCRLARAVGSPSVVFSTTNGTVGVLTAQTDRIRWTKPWTEVRGLAALPSSVVVSDAKGVSLLDMRDGTPQARYEKDGMEFGQVAAEMPWFVVEERTGNRLLRLEVGE